MAGDWIKMRVWLRRDPKVSSIADYLATSRPFINWLTDPVRRSCKESAYEYVTSDVTRAITIVSLLEVWGVARDRGDRENDDLILWHCDLGNLDDICGTPCFGEAMEYVGWAEEITKTDSQGREITGVRFPKFFREGESPEERYRRQHRNAQARYRGKNRSGDITSDITSDITRDVTRDVTMTLEKRREEKNTLPPLPPSLDTEEFRIAWAEWTAYRKERRKALTPTTVKRQFKLLEPLGPDVAAATIRQSITQGWTGLFPQENQNGQATDPSGRVGRTTRIEAPPGKYDQHPRLVVAEAPDAASGAASPLPDDQAPRPGGNPPGTAGGDPRPCRG